MKYQVPIVIALIILLIFVFYWHRKRKEKNTTKDTKSKKSKRANKKASAAKSTSTSASVVNDQDLEDELDRLDDDQDGEDNDLMEDARQLYDLVHEDLAGGMQITEFEEQVEDLAGDNPTEVFIELKQKYTAAIDQNKDPLKTVTLHDYVSVLKHTD